MAKIDDIRAMFNEIEGIEIKNDDDGNIQDIILPPSCEIISKSVSEGILIAIQFRKEDTLYTYEK